MTRTDTALIFAMLCIIAAHTANTGWVAVMWAIFGFVWAFIGFVRLWAQP